MKLTKGIIALSISLILSACGGGGGFFEQSALPVTNNDSTTGGSTGNSTATQTTFSSVEQEGKFLFGFYDVGQSTLSKGFIDHALDTFNAGPLKLGIDAREALELELNSGNTENFSYNTKCMTSGPYSNSGCYYLIGNEQIKAALSTVKPGVYDSWDFDISSDDLSNIKLSDNSNYIGKSVIIVFENQNIDKTLNDTWVSGVFSYPFLQNWGLTQTNQVRFVSMQSDGSEFNVILSGDEGSQTKGALSVYKDPLYALGNKYVLQGGSAFEVLINDNPSTPDPEPIQFTVNSTPGNSTTLSSYVVNNDGSQILDLRSITAISANRISNNPVQTGAASFSGSVNFQGNNIFNFLNSTNGSTLKFKHVFNNVTFEGTSTVNSGVVSTQFTLPFVTNRTYTQVVN